MKNSRDSILRMSWTVGDPTAVASEDVPHPDLTVAEIPFGSGTTRVAMVRHRCPPVWCSVCRCFQVRRIEPQDRGATLRYAEARTRRSVSHGRQATLGRILGSLTSPDAG